MAPGSTAWADEAVRALMFEGGDDAWRLLLALVEQARDDVALSCIGAGPIEDLLNDQSAQRFLDRFTAQLSVDRKLRVALSSAWGLPAPIAALAALNPPGPDPAHPVPIDGPLLDRFVAVQRALKTGATPEGAHRAAALEPHAARAVSMLVAAVAAIARADAMSRSAEAMIAGASELRRNAMELMKVRFPGAASSLPDLDTPEATAYFAERDAQLAQTLRERLGARAEGTARLDALRAAWGADAVQLVLDRLDELAPMPAGDRWPKA